MVKGVRTTAAETLPDRSFLGYCGSSQASSPLSTGAGTEPVRLPAPLPNRSGARRARLLSLVPGKPDVLRCAPSPR